MNSLELFNQVYTNETERAYAISLLDFFKREIQKRLSHEAHILDLGSGSKSLFEEDLGLYRQHITAIDFSPVAILKAQGKSEIKYLEVDVTIPKSLGYELYDLVFDSHCIHCITDKAKREKAFNNIFNSLKADGIAAFEMMILSSSRAVAIPGKYVVDARELEQEILSYGFKIIYFMIVGDLSFENENRKCDLVRVIVRK